MTKEKLINIGNEIARLWGGACTDCNKDSEGNYVFSCIEHGEYFCVKCTPEELLSYC